MKNLGARFKWSIPLFLLSLLVGTNLYAITITSPQFEKELAADANGDSEEIQTQKLIDRVVNGKLQPDGTRKGGITTFRDAHPKTHGCIDDVTVTVNNNLGNLQVGLFAEAGHQYKAIIRPSHGDGRIDADDRKNSTQGFALKILLDEKTQGLVADLPGEGYFLDRKFYKTYDILTINGLHEFMVSTISDYPDFMDTTQDLIPAAIGNVMKTTPPTDLNLGAKIAAAVDAAFDAGYFHLKSPGKVRFEEAMLIQKTQTLENFDPLDTTYQSWVPSLLGKDQAVKYQIRPCLPTGENPNPNNVLKGEALAKQLGVLADPNRLRAVLKARLRAATTCYELAVQVLNVPGQDPKNYIEHAEKAWPESGIDDSYITVATIDIPRKAEGAEVMDDKTCQTFSFNPGHTTPDHFPIGNIQRARVRLYAQVETARNTHRLEEEAKAKAAAAAAGQAK